MCLLSCQPGHGRKLHNLGHSTLPRRRSLLSFEILSAGIGGSCHLCLGQPKGIQHRAKCVQSSLRWWLAWPRSVRPLEHFHQLQTCSRLATRQRTTTSVRRQNITLHTLAFFRSVFHISDAKKSTMFVTKHSSWRYYT